MYKNLVEVLEKNKSESIGITFIKGENNEKFVSYNKLYEKAREILFSLQSKGLKHGDEVILQIDDEEKFIYSMWACLLGGLTPLPITVGNTYEHKLRIFRVWKLLDRPHLITTEDVLDMLEKFSSNDADGLIGEIKQKTLLFNEIDSSSGTGSVYYAEPDETAFIMFSSGSTGDPKGVKTTHRNIMAVDEALIERFNITADDVSLHWMPLTHMVGVVFCHLLPVMTSTPQYLMNKNLYIQNPSFWVSKVCEHKATILLTANFGMRLFLSTFKPEMAKGWDLSHVKIITLGGEALSTQLIDGFMGLLKNFGADKSMMCPVYGITEAMVAACGAPGKGIGSINLNRRQLSIGVEIEETMDRENGITFAELGYPPSGCNVRICDDADCILESGRVGHIQVSGPNVMPGYYKNEEETKKVFTQDGWYRTGDIGFIKDGKVTITGRAKEMVIVNMINYYLFDIERTAESIEGIRPGTVSACGALNKETMSDDIYLFVLFEGEVKDFVDIAKSIKIQIKNRIGLDVKRVIPTKNVPRTGLGKINRQMLKGMFDEGKFEGIVEELENLINEKTESRIIDVPQSEIEEKLSKIWMKILGVKSVGINDNFFELGGQSIKVPELAAEIANEFNVEVHLRVLYENPTIKSIAESIKSLR